MEKKLIVSDMDETFLRADKTYDKEKASKAISKLLEDGHIVVIASGNPHTLLIDYFDSPNVDQMYFAGDNGNVLVKGDEIIRAISPDRKVVEEVFTEFSKKEGLYPVLSTGEEGYAHSDLTEHAKEQIGIYYKKVNLIDSFEEFPEDEVTIKIDIYSDHPLEENKQMTEQIEKDFDGVTSVTSDVDWLDVYSDKGGKGVAVKELQEKYGIAKEDTMCFGDSLNDLSMMKEAGYAVAMSNADYDLVQYCNYQIGSNENQSVQAVLEQIAEDGNLDFMERFKI